MKTKQCLVIGLGRFGTAVATTLYEMGHEVVAIDQIEENVQRVMNLVTHAAIVDASDERALRAIGASDFDVVVVAIGTDVQANILATMNAKSLGAPYVVSKAIDEMARRVLERIGADLVIRPEHDMGQRVAHLVRGRMLDYIEFDDGYALIKTQPPAAVLGKPLGETRVRSYYNVTVVGVKRAGQSFTYATPETVLEEGDIVIVSGERDAVENFSDET